MSTGTICQQVLYMSTGAICQQVQYVNRYYMSTGTICQQVQYVNRYNMSTGTICQQVLYVNRYNMSTGKICQQVLYVNRYNMSTGTIWQQVLYVNRYYMSTGTISCRLKNSYVCRKEKTFLVLLKVFPVTHFVETWDLLIPTLYNFTQLTYNKLQGGVFSALNSSEKVIKWLFAKFDDKKHNLSIRNI